MATTIIMSLQQKKRLRLITPNIPAKGKILKSCVRCRQHKTKCDAVLTNPFPCTHCYKKNINCTLDMITTTPKRAYDVVEKLTNEVQNLRYTLDSIIEKKNHMIKLLIENSHKQQQQEILPVESQSPLPATPSVTEIQSVLNSPQSSPLSGATPIDPIPTKVDKNNNFVISSNNSILPIVLSYNQALNMFDNYHINFHKYLPILPDSFFEDINLNQVYKENDLLFWSIILTSYLNQDDYNSYLTLADHVKKLVVFKCWLNTPRSVYAIASLLILTTWPLPMEKLQKIQDNLSVKYISLMKNLSLQLGLHKLEFINEFSHKTKVNMASESDLNNLIRERIYKFININSNYWLVFLGLANSNYNGLHQDYIINKAANIDLFNNNNFTTEDNFINSLLKISLIQLKLNENMNDLIDNPNHVRKLIDLNMFEIILNDFNNFDDNNKLFNNNLIKLSIEFTKLQLFTYSFSNINLSIDNYKRMIYKCINCCQLILNLFHQEFNAGVNFNQLPIHYKFIIELSLLTLLRIFKSPLLNSVNDYKSVRQLFSKFFDIFHKENSSWNDLNSKLFKILSKYDKINNLKILKNDNYNSFFLVNKMKNYLISSLHYELIWTIYDEQKSDDNSRNSGHNDNEINWDMYGLNRSNDGELIKFISTSPSVFNSNL